MSNEEKSFYKSSINWEITTYGKLYKGDLKWILEKKCLIKL